MITVRFLGMNPRFLFTSSKILPGFLSLFTVASRYDTLRSMPSFSSTPVYILPDRVLGSFLFLQLDPENPQKITVKELQRNPLMDANRFEIDLK